MKTHNVQLFKVQCVAAARKRALSRKLRSEQSPARNLVDIHQKWIVWMTTM